MAQYKDTLWLIDKVTRPLAKIAVGMEKTQEKTKKFEGRLGKLQRRLSYVGKQFTETGRKWKEAGSKITGVMSKIGLSFGAFSGAVGMAFNRVRGYIDRFVEKADHIDKASQKIGMSARTYQELDYIMQQNGGNVDSLQMGYKTLAAQMVATQKKTKGSINAFDRLGVKVKKSNGQFRTQEEVFWDSIEALRKVSDTTQRAALGSQLFGRGFIELKPLLNNTTEEFEKLRKEAQKTIIDDKIIKQATSYKDSMNRLALTFQAKLAPAFANVMPKIEEIMTKLSETDIIERLINLVIKLTEKIIDIVDWFMKLSKGGKIATGIFAGFLAILGPLISTVGTVIMAIGGIATALETTSAVVATAIGTFLGWPAVFAGIAAGIWAVIKAIQVLIGWIQHLKRLKINNLDTSGLSNDALDKLRAKRAEMGAAAFDKQYPEIAKQIKNTTTNNNQTYNNQVYNNYNTNNYGGSGFLLQPAYIPRG